MRKVSLCCILLLVVLLLPIMGLAANVLTINQVVQEGGEVYLYALLTDEKGELAAAAYSIDKMQVKLGADTQMTPVSAQAFSQGEEGMTYTLLVDLNRNITNQEFTEMQQALKTLVSQMRDNDQAKIITLSDSVTTVVDYTKEKMALTTAIEGLEKSRNTKVNLYQGLNQALTAWRARKNELPRRSAVVLFTYGGDDASGYSEGEIGKQIAAEQIPLYIVGLKGPAKVNDKTVTTAQHNARLAVMGQLARGANGGLLMTTDMTIAEATQKILGYFSNTLVLTVEPPYGKFGMENASWRIALEGNNGSVESAAFVTDLTTENVPTPSPVPTQVPTATPAPTEEIEDPDPFEAEIEPEATEEPAASMFSLDSPFVWGGIAAVVVLVVVLIIVLVRRSKKKREEDAHMYDGFGGSGAGGSDAYSQGDGDYGEKTTNLFDLGEATIGLDADGERTLPTDFQSRQLRVTFVVDFEGKVSRESRAVGKGFIIGRGDQSNLRVADKSVSRKQCELTYDLAGLFIEDLGSLSGTTVNGQRINGKVPLKHMDKILMGNTLITVEIQG